MTENNIYLFQTNNFHREWTWIRRIIFMIFLSIGILLLPLNGELQVLEFILITVAIFYLIALPVDDMTVSESQLFHIRTSVVPQFSKIDTYELSQLTSLRCGGIHSDKWELVDIFNGGNNMGGFSNTVEMSFQDGSSKSLELAISRDKLDKLIAIAYELKMKRA